MNHVQNSHLVAAAIGAAVGVISAASIFIYHKIIENKQHTMTSSNLDLVNQRIAEIQAEIEALRVQQNQMKKKRRINRRNVFNDSTYTATDNDTDVDAFSTAGTDIGDDEFFDCSDSEGAAGDNEPRTSEAMNDLDLVLAAIDESTDTEEEFSKDTYYKLKTLANLHPESVDVIWRFARACYNYTTCISDLETKKSIINDGLEACEKIISFKDADLHKWYAVLTGLLSEFSPSADKIKNGYRFKDHILIALQLRPNDPGLHHLLGRFKYEVSGLTWIERKIAAALFAEPPSASYEDAIESFEQAEKFATKPHLENRLFLSKSYIALNQYAQAIQWLHKVCEIPALTKEDQRVQEEANELLTKYSGYDL